jgi:hypothetical protein
VGYRGIVMVVFLPVIVFLWVVGWSLFWIGSESKPQRAKGIVDDGLSFMYMQHEEERSKLNQESKT